jgi:5,10-methylenetetrahydrofolate reductase
LTGTPAWGDASPEDDAESWELVHFIRSLPEISADELRLMASLNPTGREELERELEIERFLAGDSSASPEAQGHDH